MSAGYAALRESAAWVDASGRGTLRVTGEDRARLLHALCTNHVQALTPGGGCYAFFLTAQGRIFADATLLCREDDFLLDTEPELAARLAAHIDKYIIADDAVVEDVTANWCCFAVEGPQASRVLASLGAAIPAEENSHLGWKGGLVARISLTGAGGFLLRAPAEQRESIAASLSGQGAVAVTEEDFRIRRIENGRPRYGEDISERYLAQETGQLQALHFSKGCYLGQEIVERVRSRAQIHRVLAPLEIATGIPPAPGTKLQRDGHDAAEITSSAFSPDLGKAVALAYVRVEAAAPGSELMLGPAVARVRDRRKGAPPG
jgi:folate-binding protein YgfZ